MLVRYFVLYKMNRLSREFVLTSIWCKWYYWGLSGDSWTKTIGKFFTEAIFISLSPFLKNYLTGQASVSLLQMHNSQIDQQVGVRKRQSLDWLLSHPKHNLHADCLRHKLKVKVWKDSFSCECHLVNPITYSTRKNKFIYSTVYICSKISRKVKSYTR